MYSSARASITQWRIHGEWAYEYNSPPIRNDSEVIVRHYLIVRLVAIRRTCDRSAMFATISRSGRMLRSVFFAGGRSSYDWSYARSRDQERLEKIVRLVVAIQDRSCDQSWPPPIDRTTKRGFLRPKHLHIL